MKLMVVGGGGREHAIIKKLLENPAVDSIYALPGNAGMAKEAVCVGIKADDVPAIVRFAKETGIDYAVVAPDNPLVDGCVNALEAAGIPCFGPRAEAAIIEGSKVFAKDLMKKYGIPTAAYEVFRDPAAALEYVRSCPLPTVIKADGLAFGKGVIICMEREEAVNAVRSIMEEGQFGASGNSIVVEEYLEGPEVSVLVFTDGRTAVPMVSSMDHKRALDGDRGLNTGGMGAVAPNPYYTPAVAERCLREIILPTIDAMNKEGRTFKGCLYCGLMITKDGPKVIEYNCRFGDPETQVVLPLLKTDLLSVMRAVTEERLAELPVEWEDKYACCVVVASEGYPEAYQKGFEVRIPDALAPQVYAAGVAEKDGKLVNGGGRVLGCTALGSSLREAIDAAYRIAEQVAFEHSYYRKDIGARALRAQEEN